LHTAVLANNIKIIDLLIGRNPACRKKIDFTIKNNSGQSALKLAQASDNHECIDALHNGLAIRLLSLQKRGSFYERVIQFLNEEYGAEVTETILQSTQEEQITEILQKSII